MCPSFQEGLCLGAGGFWAPYATFISISIGYAIVAGSLVAFVEPLAAGSGIPEIKTYLNGIHIKGLLTVSSRNVQPSSYAMYQPWARDAVVPGRVPLVWVFPPLGLIGSALGKLHVEQVDAIWVVPRFHRYWQALIFVHILAYFTESCWTCFMCSM